MARQKKITAELNNKLVRVMQIEKLDMLNNVIEFQEDKSQLLFGQLKKMIN